MPRPSDVLLLIEVADTSLDKDREIKLPLYARSAVPEVWIVDLAADVIEVYRDPGAYRGPRPALGGRRAPRGAGAPEAR